MTDSEFIALLDLYANTIIWTGRHESKQILADLLNRESAARGYDNWMAAFKDIDRIGDREWRR